MDGINDGPSALKICLAMDKAGGCDEKTGLTLRLFAIGCARRAVAHAKIHDIWASKSTIRAIAVSDRYQNGLACGDDLRRAIADNRNATTGHDRSAESNIRRYVAQAASGCAEPDPIHAARMASHNEALAEDVRAAIDAAPNRHAWILGKGRRAGLAQRAKTEAMQHRLLSAALKGTQ